MKTINDMVTDRLIAKLANLQQESARWEALAQARAKQIKRLLRHIESMELELLELTAEKDT